MNWSDLNLIPVMPEIVLPTLLGVVLLVDLWICDENRYLIRLVSLGAVIIMAVAQSAVQEQGSIDASHDMYTTDGMSRLAKLMLHVLMSSLLIYSEPYNQDHQTFKDGFYTLSLFALLSMSIMVGAAYLLVTYIGLELLSLSLYTMTALCHDSGRSTRAVLEHFALNALASDLLFYGISMVCGVTGSLDFAFALASAFSEQADEWLLKLGVVFIAVAIIPKLGTIPFHIWVPDVYDGALTSIVAFVGTAPKVAAVIFAFHILVTGVGIVHLDQAPMLVIPAVASLAVGNLAAVMQTNAKRMLIYPTVSHAGFILLMFMAGAVGFMIGLCYVITYALMAATSFDALMVSSTKDIECENIKDLAGLNQRHARFVFLISLSMFSVASIPPLMDFHAKFGVIVTLLEQGHVWLPIFAVIMSLTDAFYYLRMAKVIYFDAPNHDQPVGSNYAAKFVLTVNALPLFLRGTIPQAVIDRRVKALENTL